MLTLAFKDLDKTYKPIQEKPVDNQLSLDEFIKILGNLDDHKLLTDDSIDKFSREVFLRFKYKLASI